MATFEIEVVDRDTGSEYKIKVDAHTRDEAVRQALARGFVIGKVRDVYEESEPEQAMPAASVANVQSEPWARRRDAQAEKADAALILFSVLVPLVGIIAGSIRLARSDPSGIGPIVAAMISTIVCVVMCVALIMANTT